MINNKEKLSGDGLISALMPRGLIGNAANILSSKVSYDGLCPVKIKWKDRKVVEIDCLSGDLDKKNQKILLPRLIEPHAHLDKAFTWANYPNFRGTYSGALEANLKEHLLRSPEKVNSRAEKAISLCIKNGLRAVRTHIDGFGLVGSETWKIINALRKKWKEYLEIQCVALVPLDYWSSSEGLLLASKVAEDNGLFGGVLVPPFDKSKTKKNLLNLLKVANDYGCGIDLHIDESSSNHAAGLNVLMKVLEEFKSHHVPITCSHASSLGLINEKKINEYANKLSDFGISVVALPLTNSWLLGRQAGVTPTHRPIAPIRQLQNKGVNVAIGCDNVQDPWFPLGNFDPISLMSISMPFTQLAPWERLGLSAFTTSSANVLGLKWDGLIELDCPADFVVLEADSWSSALSTSPNRQNIINGDYL